MNRESLMVHLKNINYWWTEGSVKDADHGIIRRKYIQRIEERTEIERIICISGVRRSGKSTLVYQYIRGLLEKGVEPKKIVLVKVDLCLRDLDDLRDIISVYKELTGIDPQNDRAYLFFDEVHYMDDWQVQVKEFIDMKYRSRFFVLGSSVTMMFKDASESLAGRISFIHVDPLSFREYLIFSGFDLPGEAPLDDMHKALIDKKDLILHHLGNYIETGGFPEWFKINDIERWRRILFEDYLSLILMKDIVHVFKIKDPRLLENLVREVAHLSCERFSYKGLSERLDSDRETIKLYLYYLKTSGLIHVMKVYSKKKISRERSEKKIYFFDEGMRKALTLDMGGIRFSEVMAASHLTALGKEMNYLFEPHYWKNDREVDYVYENRGVLVPVETKYRNDPGDINGVIEFLEKYHLKRGIIVTKDTFKIEDHGDTGVIQFIPLWLFLISDHEMLGMK
ncbi:MAG: ATP-binding protein [Thermoplasmatota archaeon]